MTDTTMLIAAAQREAAHLRGVARAQTKVIEEETARAEIAEVQCARLKEALCIIAGEQQCADNLMSDKDIARAALSDTAQQDRFDSFRPATCNARCGGKRDE